MEGGVYTELFYAIILTLFDAFCWSALHLIHYDSCDAQLSFLMS